MYRAAPLHAITGINAAAAAAAAELAAAIHSAPASQLALAAMAAGGTAATGDGVVRVKVPGVAGAVELVSEAAAGAAAGDSGSEGAAASEGRVGEEGGDGVAEGEEEGRLPDLGAGEDGQPLSRNLRQQEGLASWATFGQPV